MKLLKRIDCFFRGHPAVKTGRHGILLTEWACQRCGRLYVSHAHYGNTLVPANIESDRIFERVQEEVARG